MIALLFAASVALLPTATPAPSPDPTFEYEAGMAYETLSNNEPVWDSQYLRVTSETAGHHIVYGEVESASRFSRRADAFTLGMYVPIGAQWQVNAETTASSGHDVLPDDSVMTGLTYSSGGNWFESVSARTTQYDAAAVNSATLSLEHYWGDYRAYYLLTAAHLEATGTDVEHAAELDRYYGRNERSYVGIGYLTGREIDGSGLPVLLVSHVDGWNIAGRHFLNGNWAVVYAFGSFAQGTLYTKTGGRLGFEYRF